jgi:uncharacterized protein
MGNDNQTVKVAFADPSALGLFGLAMVTLVASSQKLGITEGYSLLIPWAFFLGALAQLFAAIGDAKRNNVFGTTAFGGYAFFWMSMVLSWLMKIGAFGPLLAGQADGKQMGFAFLGYLIFSVFMTIAATETNKVLFAIFVFIDLLFLGLTANSFGILAEPAHMLAAYSELTIALLSFYGSAANVLNTQFGRNFLPQGRPLGIFKKHASVAKIDKQPEIAELKQNPTA